MIIHYYIFSVNCCDGGMPNSKGWPKNYWHLKNCITYCPSYQ